MTKNWSRYSYKSFVAKQQPAWPDAAQLKKNLDILQTLPSLVFSGETRKLKSELSDVNRGKSFVLQVGNCSESFSDCNGPLIHNYLRIVLQMALVLTYKSKKNIIKIGRVAGQYAKPRSLDYEEINGQKLPSYRGDIVNGNEADIISRTPDPDRLREAYFRSAATLNLIRAFTQGGYSNIENVSDWEHHFFDREIANLEYYKGLSAELKKSIGGIIDADQASQLANEIYISHEALLLDYEAAFTRLDTTYGGEYNTAAHTVWIGDRTRDPDGAHIEYTSGIGNPIGIKIGPGYMLDEILKILEKVNPENEPGKIMLICRMGKDKVAEKLPGLIESVRKTGAEVIWCCDPMHGNTFSHGKYKVRAFEDIVFETKEFFRICRESGAIPGGIHLEITGEFVSECTGGVNGLSLSNIGEKYETKVDPRLNAAQALEFAFVLGELIAENDNK